MKHAILRFSTALSVMAVSGIFICVSRGFISLLISYFILYLGNGMLEISLNIIAATLFTKKLGTMMNLAHFFYGAGSVFSPVISARLMAARFGEGVLSWRYMYLIVMSCALIPVIPALVGRLEKREYNKKKTGYRVLLKNPTFWLTVSVLTLGSICEMGVGAWLVNYLEKSLLLTGENAAFLLTVFFVCFTLSRLFAGPVTDKFGFINSLAFSTGFAGVMITAGVLCGKPGVALLIIAGIGVAPVYPTVMAVISKLFSDEIDLAMTAVTTVMGILMVPANLLPGLIVYFARFVFTNIYGEAGVGMAYSAGYLFLGLCCMGSAACAVVLRNRQKNAGRLV